MKSIVIRGVQLVDDFGVRSIFSETSADWGEYGDWFFGKCQ